MIRKAHLATGCAIAFAYLALLLLSVDGLGYARDEGFYFFAAQTYEGWFRTLFDNPSAALAPAAIDRAFMVNREHPVFIKSLFAISHWILFERLHLFSEAGTSMRFPAMALSAALVGVVYHWGARTHGRVAGVSAAAMLAFMPRFFFHAHLACFDAPIAAMWTFTAYAYARALEGGRRWLIVAAILFGLSLNTKHNAWFVPIAVATHLGCMALWHRWTRRATLEPSSLPMIRNGALALVAMLTLGPLVCFATWPWIWHDTHARLSEYVAFHWHHEYYNMEFLGQNYHRPPMPRGYAPLMTAATVPLITLLLFVAGLGGRLKKVALAAVRREPSSMTRFTTDALWLLGIGVAYAPWLSTNTPIFGGTKHWMTAYPFVALFAGVAFARVVRVVVARIRMLRPKRPLLRPGVVSALAAVLLAPSIVPTLRAHPFGLSSYTPLVGGVSGAATLGLNRGFWGYTTGAVTEYLNREVPPNGTVYIHDTAIQSWNMLRTDGRLRPDIRAVWSVADADFALYHPEQHMQGQEQQNWVAFGTTAPDLLAGPDGVPVIFVYRR